MISPSFLALLSLMEALMANEHTTNWPDLAMGLFDQLTGRNAEIAYELADMHVKIPSGTGAQAEHAEWIFSGTMKIRTSNLSKLPN
jgi:hypothetical protein